MAKKHSFRIQLIVALLIASTDFFHLGLVYPLFTDLLTSSGDTAALSAPVWMRAMGYSVLIAAFPFGQFVGAPLLGRLSDRYGRRQLLLFTVAGSGFGMAISGSGVAIGSYWVVLAGRLLGGVMGANMALAYAAIVDLSTPDSKVRNLALVPLVTSLGFVLGPLMTAVVGQSVDHPSLPLWIGGGISLLNWCAVWAGFSDTCVSRPSESCRGSSIARDSRLWTPMCLVFLMITANFLLIQFIGPFASQGFRCDLTAVSWIYVNLSLTVAVGHLVLTRNLARWATPSTLLPWSLGGLAASLIAVVSAATLLQLHLAVSLAMLCCAVAYTNVIAHLSNQADASRQGEVMGLGVSIQCLAEWLPPLCVGSIATSLPAIPMIVGSLGCVIGTVMLTVRTPRFIES